MWTTPRADYDVFPGVTEYDGIPRTYFEITWLMTLTAALGAIVQVGYTLLQTAREQDGGRAAEDTERQTGASTICGSRG